MQDLDIELIEQASGFASDLDRRLHAIVETEGHFSAQVSKAKKSKNSSIFVGCLDDQLEIRSFPLTVGNKHQFDLLVKFDCCWDSAKKFITVEKSRFTVSLKSSGSRGSGPLFRYEYVRNPSNEVPASHLHVHAHRDEFTYFLIHGDGEKSHRTTLRKNKGTIPKIAEYHFPTGGHRFRPCLEDVLQNLIIEFGVDAKIGWEEAVASARDAYRQKQLKAAVRDRPEAAAEMLRSLNYKVEAPEQVDTFQSERFIAY